METLVDLVGSGRSAGSGGKFASRVPASRISARRRCSAAVSTPSATTRPPNQCTNGGGILSWPSVWVARGSTVPSRRPAVRGEGGRGPDRAGRVGRHRWTGGRPECRRGDTWARRGCGPIPAFGPVAAGSGVGGGRAGRVPGAAGPGSTRGSISRPGRGRWIRPGAWRGGPVCGGPSCGCGRGRCGPRRVCSACLRRIHAYRRCTGRCSVPRR